MQAPELAYHSPSIVLVQVAVDTTVVLVQVAFDTAVVLLQAVVDTNVVLLQVTVYIAVGLVQVSVDTTAELVQELFVLLQVSVEAAIVPKQTAPKTLWIIRDVCKV